MSVPLRVLLADDHRVVRQGVRSLLEREGFEIVGDVADGDEAVSFAKAHATDVAILDVSMPHVNGLDAAREILRSCPGIGVILLTVHTEEHQIIAAFRLGVRGYVLKTQTAGELLDGIREVAAGGRYLSPRISRVIVDAYLAGRDRAQDPLTPRQAEIVQLIAEGKTTKEIARTVGITVKTVESYRARVMQRLNLHDTASLVRYAIRHGLVEP